MTDRPECTPGEQMPLRHPDQPTFLYGEALFAPNNPLSLINFAEESLCFSNIPTIDNGLLSVLFYNLQKMPGYPGIVCSTAESGATVFHDGAKHLELSVVHALAPGLTKRVSHPGLHAWQRQ